MFPSRVRVPSLPPTPYSSAERALRSHRRGPWFDSRCGDCGRSSVVERQVVALEAPVQLRSITPSERADDGESGPAVTRLHTCSGGSNPPARTMPAQLSGQSAGFRNRGSGFQALSPARRGLGEFRVELLVCKTSPRAWGSSPPRRPRLVPFRCVEHGCRALVPAAPHKGGLPGSRPGAATAQRASADGARVGRRSRAKARTGSQLV